MNRFAMNELHAYLEKHYLNINNKDIRNMPSKFPECIYWFCDPWMYTMDDFLYKLRCMDFQIGHDGNNYFFIAINNNISRGINPEDIIVDYSSKQNILSGDDIEKGIRIKDKQGKEKIVYFHVPTIEPSQFKFEVEAIDKNICYLKMDSFSNLNYDVLSKAVSGFNTFDIDLRGNMGGRINDMIACLAIFIDKNISLNFINGTGQIRKKTVHPLETRGSIKRINFLVSEKTASSAEIFISSLHSLYEGTIYGEKTKGKFVVQKIFTIEDARIAVPEYLFLPDNAMLLKEVAIKNSCIFPQKSITDYKNEREKIHAERI